MSTKRELTRAQQALNVAVDALLDVIPPTAWRGEDDGVPRDRLTDLLAARDHYDAVRRDLEGRGITGTRETSIAASLPDQGTKRRAVLNTIAAHWARFRVGMTTDAVERHLDWPHQTVSARVHELEQRGLLVDSGLKAKTRRGRNAIVYVPSEHARKLLGAQLLADTQMPRMD